MSKNIAYVAVGPMVEGSGPVHGDRPAVGWSAIIVGPGDHVVRVIRPEDRYVVSFGYGVTGQQIRDAIITAVQAADEDPELQVVFASGA